MGFKIRARASTAPLSHPAKRDNNRAKEKA
jgi:hypothetical protein